MSGAGSQSDRAEGWYPDPWGTEGERYYDGTAWARSTRRSGGPEITEVTEVAPGSAGGVPGPEGSAATPPPAPAPRHAPAVPAGWHPDPWGAATLRWWDGTRWTGHVSGGASVALELEPERAASRWARLGLLWAGPAQAVGVVAGAFQWAWISDHWDELTGSGDALGGNPNPLASAVGQVSSLAVLAAAVLFLVWFHRSASFAAAAGIPRRRSPGLATASFLIPILNLWWPYQSTCDLLPSGHPARPRVLRWWLLWIGSVVGGVLVALSAFVSNALLAVVAAATAVLWLLAALAARAVVAEVIDAHGALSERVAQQRV